jgi:hypothetical protein
MLPSLEATVKGRFGQKGSYGLNRNQDFEIKAMSASVTLAGGIVLMSWSGDWII